MLLSCFKSNALMTMFQSSWLMHIFSSSIIYRHLYQPSHAYEIIIFRSQLLMPWSLYIAVTIILSLKHVLTIPQARLPWIRRYCQEWTVVVNFYFMLCLSFSFPFFHWSHCWVCWVCSTLAKTLMVIRCNLIYWWKWTTGLSITGMMFHSSNGIDDENIYTSRTVNEYCPILWQSNSYD